MDYLISNKMERGNEVLVRHWAGEGNYSRNKISAAWIKKVLGNETIITVGDIEYRDFLIQFTDGSQVVISELIIFTV